MPIDPQVLARIRTQMERGDFRLFIGAGFSRDAKSISGGVVPSTTELRDLIWQIAFPGEPIDNTADIGDVYQVAFRASRVRLESLLRRSLQVDSASLSAHYAEWFSAPWARVFTLNVDDLEEAAARAFSLPRKVVSLSALSDDLPPETAELLFVHLNGRVDDFPRITFSPRDYSERAVAAEAWYHHLVTELSTFPILFVGTELREPPLWAHVRLRQMRRRGTRELRPGSYLVSPTLPAARRAMLEEYNIRWIEMSAADFATKVLSSIAGSSEIGRRAIASRVAGARGGHCVQRVSELRTQAATDPADYLLGRSPTWSDVVSGFAVERGFERHFVESIPAQPVSLLVGTAGTGKTTTLLRAAVTLQSGGKEVIWVDTSASTSLHALRREITAARPDVIAIDDLDAFQRQAGGMLVDIHRDNPQAQVIAALRTTKLDQLDVESRLKGVDFRVEVVPHLGDDDIALLVDALTRANRLGALRELSRREQEGRLRERAGRQLLVAMIEATSNERFEEKVDAEFRELLPEAQLIYSIICLATSLRAYLLREELLAAAGDVSNDALNRVERLIAQKMVSATAGSPRFIAARHRVIAERVVSYCVLERALAEAVTGLLWAMASKVGPMTAAQSRERRLLNKLMNHDFMKRMNMTENDVRSAYSDVEQLLDWDYHYFLQRGSFETEFGDLDRAKNDLDQARAMAPTDHKVKTEWAYMTLKRAAESAESPSASAQAEEAFAELHEAIASRGSVDSYPFHVTGSQGLRWARRAPLSAVDRENLLLKLQEIVADGLHQHPGRPELKKLLDDIRQEYLMTAVNQQKERSVKSPLKDDKGDDPT